jgi:hypothetical protein
MKRMLLLALALLASPAMAATELDYAAAKALADKDEASLGREQGSVLLDAQAKLLGDGIAACAMPNPDFTPFVVVMELDASGKVIRTWLQGDSPLAICFRKFAARGELPAPPRTPFYSSIELSFTK